MIIETFFFCNIHEYNKIKAMQFKKEVNILCTLLMSKFIVVDLEKHCRSTNDRWSITKYTWISYYLYECTLYIHTTASLQNVCIRYHSRFFDFLAHTNLSATLATDQKWPLCPIHVVCFMLVSNLISDLITDLISDFGIASMLNYTVRQGRRKVWKSGGASSNGRG